ncbi:MAG TPA: DNA polymerase I [Tepidisphaeraceae bacterium]|jgi:DNA polymerase-1
MPDTKSFYIIDGHAHIYRAYFAPFRDLTSPTGEPVKATYVFTQMLLNLIEQRKPDYLAMVIDAGDETVFRKEIAPDYKATRQQRPDDFFPQEQRILRIVRDAGIPIFSKGGFEADDLIATMAARLCDKGYHTFMVTKDKDLRQSLNDCTFMYDVQGDEVIDAKKLEEKVGYRPDEAIEVQTLMGDAIDNVPGIPGVGEKTAAKLVRKYGSAAAVLDHLQELTPKMRENFEKFGERLTVSRRLVTLDKDVPFDFAPEQCRFDGLNMDGLRQHLEELSLTALLKRINGDGDTKKPTSIPSRPSRAGRFSESLFGEEPRPAIAETSGNGDKPPLQTCADCSYECVDTEEKFDIFLDMLREQKRFAFDTETTTLGAMQHPLVGMSFSWKHSTGYYLPVTGPAGCKLLDCAKVLACLKPILEDESVKKVGHNLKYDLLVMREAGVHVRGVWMDSMIAAFLLDSSRLRYGIDQLAEDYLNFKKIATTDLIGKGKKQITMDKIEMEKISCYAAEDADIALRLADLFEERLEEFPQLKKLAHEIEVPLIDVLVEMERNGIAVDENVLKEQSEVLGRRIEDLRQQILKEACCDFNPDSPKQLGDVLFNKLNLRVVKRTKTGPSTDAEVLDKLAAEHAVPRLILEYRGLVKLKNTYLDNLTQYQNPRTHRIHASFNQIGAETGRLSCSDPNLQNIPIRTDEGRRIRLAFVPGTREKNVLLTADYSQIELRFLAHFTQEPALMRAFQEDEDIHRTVASEVFNVPLEQVTRDQRGYAKTINFGIVYGVSAFGLARRIEGLSVSAAQDLINAYNKRFPSIKHFLEKCVMEAQSQGYVETIMGRRRPIPEIHSHIVAMRNAGERMAINSVVQGSAADLIKQAMLNVYRRLEREKRPSRMLLQVHDELVFETPLDAAEADAQMVREEMVNAMKLKVPLKVEVGWSKNWGEAK